MPNSVPWNSQPLDAWAKKYAAGNFIELDGRRTHYIDRGTGSPVLLLHGFFYDTFTWHKNIDALASHFRVIAPDWWGFGYSTREPLDYGYPLYARQLLLLLDTLGLESVSLVGHSMGGGTAIYFSTHHQERVDKILLVDAVGMPNELPWLGKITNLPLVGEFMYGMRGKLMRRIALKTNWIYDPAHVTDEYVENVTRFQKIAGSTEVMLKVLRKEFFHTLLEVVHALDKLNIPVLIVWGEHDRAVPLPRGREMHALLTGSRFEIFEDVGHCPHDEAAAQFNRLATQFLS